MSRGLSGSNHKHHKNHFKIIVQTMDKGEIIIYKTPDGQASIDVKLEDETVWLTQAQMAELFNTTSQNITLHIKNVFKEKELQKSSTCKDFLQVQMEGKRNVTRKLIFYNLDVIISVGYRVKSKRGTQFRIWANSVLKEYLVKGYAVNEKATQRQLDNLSEMVRVLSDAFETKAITAAEAESLLRIIKDYSYGLQTLDKYDYQKLQIEETTSRKGFKITYNSAVKAIQSLKKQFGGSKLFGNEKDEFFKSSLNTINQTFDGEELYPTLEEKAAMLVYLVVKNHSFNDGNKRIAAFLFLWFLEKNQLLYKKNGTRLLENNTLVALTLMIAQSKPEEKDTMVKVTVNLINKNN